jgi:hypothetical protein
MISAILILELCLTLAMLAIVAWVKPPRQGRPLPKQKRNSRKRE